MELGFLARTFKSTKNGGEYFSICNLPFTRTIATTSTGKVFIRVSDNCFTVNGEELINLAAEKTAFQWEIVVVHKITLVETDLSKLETFLNDIQKSVYKLVKSEDIEPSGDKVDEPAKVNHVRRMKVSIAN